MRIFVLALLSLTVGVTSAAAGTYPDSFTGTVTSDDLTIVADEAAGTIHYCDVYGGDATAPADSWRGALVNSDGNIIRRMWAGPGKVERFDFTESKRDPRTGAYAKWGRSCTMGGCIIAVYNLPPNGGIWCAYE